MHLSNSSLLRRYPTGKSCLLIGVAVFTVFGMAMPVLLKTADNKCLAEPTRDVQSSPQPQGAFRRRIICFGDSLTQYGFDPDRAGWLALLAHWWERRFDVINRGFSGYNTRWVTPLVDKLFVTGEAASVGLVIIFLGANDCVLPGFGQHVPLKEYKENLKNIVSHIRAVHPESKVLLITPPPIHEAKWTEHRNEQGREMDRKQETTMSYAKACQEVGEELSLPVVNMFDAMGSGDVKLADRYLHDGVHFTSDGNRVLFREVQKMIERKFPELDPNSARADAMQGPHWSQVDPMNPRESVLRAF